MFDLEEEFTLTESRLRSKSRNTPFLGWRVWLVLESDEGVRLSSVVYRELWPVRS